MELSDPDIIGSDATAAVLTPQGRGAIASIRVFRGSSLPVERLGRFLRTARGIPLAELPAGRVTFAHWGDEPSEDVVVCRRDPQTWQIHCHGGDAAARRILGDLESLGCRTVPWTSQSILRERFLETECLAALSQA